MLIFIPLQGAHLFDYTAEIPVGVSVFCFQNILTFSYLYLQIEGVFLYRLERVEDMEKAFYSWEINGIDNATEYRYCHNCGNKAVFTDSGSRRHNANGKDIFEFAIFKCDKGHTWNKMLGILKPTDKVHKFADMGARLECRMDSISIGELKAAKFDEIEIYIKELNSKIRLDKILSRQISDLSRNQIEKLICCGKILINGQKVKQGAFLKKEDKITITL